MSKIIVLIMFILLSGCSIFKKDAIVPPPEKVVQIDPRVLELCEPLNGLSEEATFEDLLATTVFNFELYNACAQKQRNSVILLKKFANKED